MRSSRVSFHSKCAAAELDVEKLGPVQIYYGQLIGCVLLEIIVRKRTDGNSVKSARDGRLERLV
jgi:hypothetical protein